MLSMLVLLSALLHADDPAPAPLYESAQALEATDPVAARGQYEAACADRHPAACQRLALLIMLTGSDPQGAIDALAAGCDLGDLRACASLSSIGRLGGEADLGLRTR
jgi:TPR repeat protein